MHSRCKCPPISHLCRHAIFTSESRRGDWSFEACLKNTQGCRESIRRRYWGWIVAHLKGTDDRGPKRICGSAGRRAIRPHSARGLMKADVSFRFLVVTWYNTREEGSRCVSSRQWTRMHEISEHNGSREPPLIMQRTDLSDAYQTRTIVLPHSSKWFQLTSMMCAQRCTLVCNLFCSSIKLLPS